MRFLLSRRTPSFLPEVIEKPEYWEYANTLFITIDPHANLLGEYPRRVELGEALAQKGGIRILSPVNGIATYQERQGIRHLQVVQDGSLEKSFTQTEPPNSKGDFYQLLDRLGMVSLDNSGKSIRELFQERENSQSPQLVLSPYSLFPIPHFSKMIEEEYKNEFQKFVVLLRQIFPHFQVQNLWERGLPPAKYPYQGNPKYFLQKIFKLSHPSHESSVIYLGAETIYHLLRGLFYGIPFTRRHLVLTTIQKQGYPSPKKKIYFLPNGYPIQFIQNLYKIGEYRMIHGTEYDKPILISHSEKFNWNIYQNPQFTIYLKKEKVHKELPCTECGDCNLYCPTQANPMGLILTKEPFQKEDCVDCGICTLFCPSGIDLRRRIADWNPLHLS